MRDLGRIEELHRTGGGELSETAGPGPVRLWALVSQTLSAILPPVPQETILQLAEDGGRLCGFIQASTRSDGAGLSGATALQVLNLCVDPSDEAGEVASALLEGLFEEAAEQGVIRLFVRLPIDSDLTSSFRRHGFRQYAIEYVLYSESVAWPETPEPAGLRQLKRGDGGRLYQLYRQVTPPGVAQVEAPTLRDWRSLRGDWIGQPSVRGLTQSEVVIDRQELSAWCRIQRSSSTRPSSLGFLSLPEEPLAQALVDHVLGQLSSNGSGAVWSSLRHYDSHMIEALRQRGFANLVHQSLMVRELAVRVPSPSKAMMPALSPAT